MALGWFHMVATGAPAGGLVTGGMLIDAFGWEVVFQRDRRAIAHPNPYEPPKFAYRVGALAHFADHGTVRPFGEDRHQIAVRIEGPPVIGTTQRPGKKDVTL